MRLVEEEHQLGLVDVADLVQFGVKVGEQPHQEGGEDDWAQRLTGELQQRDDAVALVVVAQQIVRVELGLAEEGVAALGIEVHQRPQDDARTRRRHPAQIFQSGLALVAGQVADDSAQLVQCHQRAADLFGPVEDQPQRRLLSSIEPQHF